MSANEIIHNIQKESGGKYGIFCLHCLITYNSFEELNEYMKKYNIEITKNTQTKTGYLKDLAVFYHNVYNNDSEIQKKYKNSSDLMGDTLLKDETLKENLKHFDFISKQELINIFSDFCADFGISVFIPAKTSDFSLDLYLTKRMPRLRTEAVFIRTGAELNESTYQETLDLIKEASNIAIWTVFVTTPAGVYKIGFEKLISDMKDLDVWLYVIDPLHRRVLGITKGKKSKVYNSDLSIEYIQKLHREPVRAPSQVVKFSKYHFKESESYKPKSFYMFGIIHTEGLEEIIEIPEEAHKYRDIFRNLMIIDIDSGVSVLAYSIKIGSIDDNLSAGFLTAMDNFVAELGGTSDLREINYKGFFIQAGYGKYIKIALFLSEPSDLILKERLAYFIEQFEEKYQEQIKSFKKTGNVTYFDKNEVIKIAKDILKI